MKLTGRKYRHEKITYRYIGITPTSTPVRNLPVNRRSSVQRFREMLACARTRRPVRSWPVAVYARARGRATLRAGLALSCAMSVNFAYRYTGTRNTGIPLRDFFFARTAFSVPVFSTCKCQILQGSFSAVSKPNFGSKYSLVTRCCAKQEELVLRCLSPCSVCN